MHLNDSLVTSTLPNVLTQIAIDSLQPGDVIDAPADPPVGGHTFLFEKWGDSAHSYYYAYDFGTTPVCHRTVFRSGSDLDTSDSRTFYAYHYPKNIDTTIKSKFAPALMYDVGDGTMRIYPWTSTGSSFAGPGSDYYQSGSFDLSNVGDLVASGDVDGDGTQDIVTAYQRSDGTFQFNVFKHGDTSSGIWYVSGSFSLSRVGGRLVVDDFNGDGMAEPALVYDNGDGTMKIYRWLSTGSSFTRTTDYQSGSFPLANVGDRVAHQPACRSASTSSCCAARGSTLGSLARLVAPSREYLQ